MDGRLLPALREGRAPCAAFLTEPESAALVGRVQAARGWPVAAAEGGLDAAATALSSGPTPAILVIDLDGLDDPLSGVERLADLCDPGTRVLALGGANDVRLFRDLLALGVDDYLTKPLVEADLDRALSRLAERPAPAPAPAAEARARAGLVAVLGARGGVGATSLAAGLAWILAEERGRRTVLVDLDLAFGTTALLFDVEPGRGLAEALSNPERVDELFLSRAAVRVSDRLSLLCAEEPPDRRLPGRPEGLAAVLDSLRSGFERVVLDLPRAAAADLPEMGEGDRIVVATDHSLAGLRDTVRLTRTLRAARPKAELLLVALQAGAPGRAEVRRADIEKAAEARVAFEVPYDAKGFVAAAQAGQPLVRHAPRSRAASAHRAVAAGLDPAGPERRGVLARFLRRG
jgi:pilus assembly protein CpaE